MEDIRLLLQQLQCPYAEADTNSWLSDGVWLDLVAWLLRNYDINMYEKLGKKVYGTSEPSREQIAVVLTQMASLLGFCAPTDTKLIFGQVKQNQKTDFLRELSQLCLDAFQARSFNTDLAALTRRDTQLISTIAEDQKSIFIHKINLFPLDMEPLLKQNDKTQTKMPQEKDIVALVNGLVAQVEAATQKLANMKEQVGIIDPSAQISTAESQRMEKNITTQFQALSGLLSQFDEVYRNEFLPWMSHSKIQPSGLGPAARQCLQSFKELDALLTDISALKQNYTNILSAASVQDLRKKTAQMDESRIASIREDIAVLERSVARRQEANASKCT